MKVAFLNPPWWEQDDDGRIRGGIRAGSRWPFTHTCRSSPDRFVAGDYMPYPFFLGYAASYAYQQLSGATVVMRDSIALRESVASFGRWLTTEKPDWIVMESATPSWEHDRAVLAGIAKLLPECRIIVTGPITSTDAAAILSLPNVVAAVRGEYEKGVVRVLRGKIGLVEHDLLTVDEMNKAPPPPIHRSTWTHYWDACPRGQIYPHLQVWSSRGCPYKCIFCVWPATMTGNDPDGTKTRRVRHYSEDYMRDYLLRSKSTFPFRSVYFDDDTFNLGDKHVLAMCRVMRDVGLPWSAMCRADTIKRETWAEMKASGCFGVKVGFESGNQWVIDNIVNKRLDLEAARETVCHLKEIGMTVHGTFTIGLPGETAEQQNDTIRFLQSLPLDSHQLSGTAEIEGTPLATLANRGHLDAYAGASLDNYVRAADGQRKIETML
jgi:hypothetical protein